MRLSPALSAPVQTNHVMATPAHTMVMTPAMVMTPTAPVAHSSFDFHHPTLGPSGDTTYEGDVNNSTLESITWNSSDTFDFRDVVDGNGGYDYIATGGGADQITVGSNDGTWRGSGNEFMNNATIVDASSGDDRVIVDATKGAFHITTGDGSDTVIVKGGDYVKIDAYDTDVQHDEFTFAATFAGKADIYGADAAFHDHISLEGGVWHEIVGGIDGTLAFYNDATHGTVEVMGSQSADIGTHPCWDL